MKLKNIKKKGALLQFDGVSYLLVLIIFIGLGIVGLGGREAFRTVSCKMEMNEISQAIVMGQHLRVDHDLSKISLPALVSDNTIPATDAVDGVKHGYLLKSTERWTTDALKDPWGHDYSFNGSTGIITSQGGLTGTQTLKVDSESNK